MTINEPIRSWLSLNCECGWKCDTNGIEAAVEAKKAHWLNCRSNDSTIFVRVQTQHSTVRVG